MNLIMTETKTMKLTQYQHQFLMNSKNKEIIITGPGKTMFNVPPVKLSH
jgi:hypothetical protein